MTLNPAVFVVAAAVVVLVFVYAYFVHEYIFKQVEQNIVQDTWNVSSELEKTIHFAKSSVKLMSYTISSKMDGPELKNPQSTVFSKIAETPFSKVEFINANGIDFSQDEDPFDASDHESFQRGMQGETGVWINFAPQKSSEAHVNVYTPLYYRDSIVGVVSGILGGNTDISSMMNYYKIYGESIVGLVCDKHMNIISSNVVSDDYGKSFEMRAQDFFPPEIFEVFKKNAVLDEPTPFRFSSIYGTSVACIFRAGGIDGFVVLMVPYHVLGGVTRAVLLQSIIAVSLVLLFFLIYMRSLYLINRRLRDEMEGKHLNVINALTESYGSAFIIDMNTGRGECYSIDKTLLRHMQDAFDKSSHYDQLMPLYVKQMVIPEDRPQFDKVLSLERLAHEFIKHNRFEFIYRVAKGKELHYLQAHFVKPSKDRKEIVIGFKIVDESMNAELEKRKELNEQRTALAKALDRARKADKAKSNFLFNMSHDIRTPMNAVLGYEALAQKYLHNLNLSDAEVSVFNHYFNGIQTAGNFLLDMINSVLNLARIESGYERIEEMPILTAELSGNLVTTFELAAQQKNIMLQVSRNIRPRYVYGDKVKIQKILLNIVGNAIKYTRSQGLVRISLRDLPHENPDMCYIEMVVEDTGVGISEDFLPNVFNAFEREQTPLTRGINGTGLGLSIVKKLVDLMHGTINITSRVGEGTRVVVVLPHRLVKEDISEKEEKQILLNNQFVGKRILLADDDSVTCEIVSDMIKSVGADIVCVGSGNDCFRKIDMSPAGTFDAVLMDLKMPRGDGIETTARIRKMDDLRKANIVIVALSASAFDEERQAALDVGVNAHVAKPVNMVELINTLSRLMV
jgi:signal transduction histidine kinase/ActR/RegA family two-component response regulator